MRKIYLLILLFLPLLSFSQNKNETWFDYNLSYVLNNKTTLFGDVGYRFAESDIVVFRPSIKYTFNSSFMIMGGIGNFYTRSPDKTFSAYEFRPWQGVRAIWPRKSYFLTLKHFLRLEEKIYTTTTSSGFEGHLRIRYQLGTEIDIWENMDGTFGISMPLEYEIFHSFNQPDFFIERDRIIAGLIFNFKKAYSLEINYTMQRKGEGYADLSPDIGIYRIRIKHGLARAKKKANREDLEKL